jgi:hypothetical protein
MRTFEDFEDFCTWYQLLNPNEPLDKHEAMTIYFYLETYGESA